MNRSSPNPITGVQRPIMSVNENGWAARLFKWCWRLHTMPQNFCLIWWGTLFLPVGFLLFRVIGGVMAPVFEWWEDKRDKRSRSRDLNEYPNEYKRPVEHRDAIESEHDRSLDFIASIQGFFTRQTLGKLRYLWVAIGALVALAVLFVAIWGVTLLVGVWDWHVFFRVLLTALVVLAGVVLVFGGGIGAAAYDDAHPGVLKHRAKRVGRWVAAPFVFLYYGLLTVKHATCPVVQAEKTPTTKAAR